MTTHPDRMARPEAIQILRDFLATTDNGNAIRALECLMHAEAPVLIYGCLGCQALKRRVAELEAIR